VNATATNTSRTILAVIAGLLALVGASYFLIAGQANGSKTITALSLGIAVAPLAIYGALRKPLLFPLCLFVFFIPFDELLILPGFGTLTRLLAVLSGAAIAFWLIRTKRVTQPPKSLFFWLLLFVWMLLTIFWAIDPSLAVSRVATFIQLFLLYAVVCLVPATLADLKAVVTASVIGGSIGAGYGAYYLHENFNKIMRVLLTNGQNVMDPNHFGAALILPVAIVTVFALSSRSMFVKVLFIALDVILFAGIYASGSRGSFVAVAVVFLYLFWASRQRLQLALVAAFGIAASFFTPTSIWFRFQHALSSGGAGREDIWHVGYAAFKQYWFLGAGLENFTLAYDRAYLQAFQQFPEGWSRAAHSLIFQYGVELGIVGLILMLAAWLVQYSILNRIGRDSNLYIYRMMAQSSLLGLFSAAMFLDVMYRKYTWLTFMVGALVYAAWKDEQHRKLQVVPGPIELTEASIGSRPSQPSVTRVGELAK